MNVYESLQKKISCLIIFLIVSPIFLLSAGSDRVEDFFEASEDRRNEEIRGKEETIKAVRDKYVLVFFYYGHQNASHDAAEYLKKLIVKYDWQSYAISLDDTLIEGFENNRLNQGIYDDFNKASPYRNFKEPSLFLFDPETTKIYWLMTGSSEFRELEHCIDVKTRYFLL